MEFSGRYLLYLERNQGILMEFYRDSGNFKRKFLFDSFVLILLASQINYVI